MKLGSLFDGIGGFPLAGTRHGIEPVWASEIEPFPIKVTKERFPNMIHLGDITKIKGASIEPVDIITFGSPCQDLSVAGKRAGLQHTDKGDETTTRSGLFMEAVRIIKEMRNATDKCGSSQSVRPRFAVWENVPGAFSSNNGEDFRVVLEELARVIDGTVSVPQPPKGKWQPAGTIMGDGYSIAWRTFDAQYWGVPQRRRRIYLVCDFAGGCAPKVLFEREGLAADASGGFNESGNGYLMPGFGTVRTNGSRPTNVVASGFDGDVARTLTRRYDSSPCADRGQNVVAISLVNRGHFRNDGTAGGASLYENHGQDSRLTGPLDISPTVAAKFGTGGNNTPLVTYRKSRRAQSADDAETWVEDGTANTVNCFDVGDVRATRIVMADGFRMTAFGEYAHDETASTVKARDYKDATDLAVYPSMRVRRLTPLECERLQGFPDGWTDIPGGSDSARYKALGNSLAIPTAEYVIEGIAVTMGKGVNP